MENAFADLAAQLASEIEFEFEKGLIAAVRSFRCLYESNHHHYNNTVHNKVAWQQISNCLKKTVIDCINRWYNLVQTFLSYQQKSICSNEPITWPHYEAFQELQPFMVTNYIDLIQTQKPPIVYSKSTPGQRETLLNELIANRLKLLSSDTPIEQVQKIWACVAEKSNSKGPRMPIIKWQRCWWDMKMRFGTQMWQIQKKQHNCVGSRPKEFLSEEDMKIMKFCGANVLHSYSSSIAVVLDSYIEFGSNREKPIAKCRKCRIFLKDFSFVLCDICRTFPNRCDICLYVYEQELVCYQLNDWTLMAKGLLPPSYHTYAELSMCINCSNELQKQSATIWRVCRVCEKSHPVLDNLFSNSNEHLREVFKSATNITFTESEGLPGYICNICKIQMQQFNNFYLRFSRAQSRLKEIHATKFIHIDPPLEEEVKPSNAETSKTSLLKRDIACMPPPAAASSTNDSIKPSKGTYILNPEITSGPVVATPPYNTLVQATPGNGFGNVQLANKAALSSTSKAAGPALKRICLSKPRTVSVATECSAIPAVVPAKRMCIGPTDTKGVVSLKPSPSASQPGQVKMITAVSTPVTGVLKLQQGTASVVTSLPAATQVLKLQQGTASAVTTLPAATQVCALQAGQVPVPQFPTQNTRVTVLKKVHANQPAVFTISGDNQHNLPPAFCIPKSLSYIPKSMPGLAGVDIQQQLHSPPTAIKTEQLDEGFPTPLNNTDSPSNISLNASTVSVGSTYMAPVPKNISQIPLDGSAGILKPNEEFFPLSTNSPNAFHNAFLNANKDIFEHKKSKCPPPVPLMETVNQKLTAQKPSPNVAEEPQQQPTQPRVRKYWGLVDEFQITSVSDKANANNESPKPTSQPEQLATLPAEIIPENEIKQEHVDNQPSMFYPDSFELNTGCPDDAVSVMINTMMTKQEPIEEEDSFKYINPPFLISYGEKESRKDTPEIENKEETASKGLEDTPTEKGKPEEDTSADDRCTSELSVAEAPATANTKNLRVKLKRSDRLQKLACRRRMTPPFQPSKSIPTRKSLRSLIDQNESK